jgi:hypothetical protein
MNRRGINSKGWGTPQDLTPFSPFSHIPEKAINKPRQIEKNGLKFTQSISPWDLPQQFRFIMDSDALTIEWHYLSDSEPTKKQH